MGGNQKYLIVLLGPTGVGKTQLSITLARFLKAPIISCDSRQFYREMKIGTAVPTAEQLTLAKHLFVGHKSIAERYSCGMFEVDALRELDNIYHFGDVAMMVGGSGLYIDAVCNGIDNFPEPDVELRQSLAQKLENEGVDAMRAMLRLLDPDYYATVDLKNSQRILKAVEVCLQTGKTYSSFLTTPQKKRDFKVVKIGLNRPRDELYSIINQRVDEMMRQGLLDEAKALYQYKNLNALNTVGYRELFCFLDGKITLEQAVELIKRNTRRFAKRQLTWWARDKSIKWFHPRQDMEIAYYCKQIIDNQINTNIS